MTMPGDTSAGSGQTLVVTIVLVAASQDLSSDVTLRYFGQSLVNAVQSGQVSEDRIDVRS